MSEESVRIDNLTKRLDNHNMDHTQLDTKLEKMVESITTLSVHSMGLKEEVKEIKKDVKIGSNFRYKLMGIACMVPVIMVIVGWIITRSSS